MTHLSYYRDILQKKKTKENQEVFQFLLLDPGRKF
jgi:hypothetical protein